MEALWYGNSQRSSPTMFRMLSVCVTPTPDPHALRSVKWHPRELDTLALASDTNVYMINVVEASQIYETVHYNDLNRLGRVFSSCIIAYCCVRL